MAKDYKAMVAEIDAQAVELFKAAPGPMRAYRGLMEEAAKDGQPISTFLTFRV